MEKPDFSTFYKFVVSVGMILLSLSIVIPWLFLHESFDSHVKWGELHELTVFGQRLVNLRQATGYWLFQNIAWFSIPVGLVGLILFALGLIRWNRRQRILDKKEDLELEKLSIEVRPMTASQVSEKALKELGMSDHLSDADWILAIYLQIHAKVLACIRVCETVQATYKVITDHQIDSIRYDLILRSKERDFSDQLIEIRYSPDKISTEWVRKMIGQVVVAKQSYMLNTKRSAQATLLFCAATKHLPDQAPEIYLQTIGLGMLVGEVACLFIEAEQINEILGQSLTKVLSPSN